MDYNTFTNSFMKELRPELLGDVELVRRDIQKINGIRDGISVIYDNSPISPTIYLDELYEQYKNGHSMSEIVNNTAYNINQHRDDIKDVPVINKDSAMSNLYCSLISRDSNKELLRNVPHGNMEDLAVVARFRVGNDGSFLVTNEMCSQLQMTSEEIIEQAKSNTINQTFKCESMQDVLRGIMKNDGISEEFVDEFIQSQVEEAPMYVLTNERGIDGATALLSKDTLNNAKEMIGEDFYVLPSSRHEVILLPESKVDDIDYLKNMVHQINTCEVSLEDRLSDNVYKYDSLMQKISIANSAIKGIEHMAAKAEECSMLATSVRN